MLTDEEVCARAEALWTRVVQAGPSGDDLAVVWITEEFLCFQQEIRELATMVAEHQVRLAEIQEESVRMARRASRAERLLQKLQEVLDENK